MTDRATLLPRLNLLLTLLCGALLLYFPWEGRPLWEILYVDDVSSYPFFLALALTFFFPDRHHIPYRRWLLWIENHPVKIGAAVFAVLAVLSPLIYQGKPLSTDEYLLWFQAHTFAEGHLFATYPREWLHHLLISHDLFLTDWGGGRILSPYWPGFSLLLAPFAALGVPWLCNPAIVGLSVYLLAAIARELFTEPETRGLVVLLALASPCFLLNGATFYAMPAHLLCNALFTWLILRPTPGRLFMAGVSGSVALVLHNPLPHLLYAAPWLLWLFFRRPVDWKQLFALLAGYAPLTLVLGVGWAILRLTSSCPFPCDTGAAPLPTHGAPAAGLASFATSAFVFPTMQILEWRAAGAIKLVFSSAPALVLLACLTPANTDVRLRCLAASALLTFAGYFLIPFDQGFGWGYRYFHSAWLTLPILAAATLRGWQQPCPDSQSYSGIVRAAVLSMAILVPYKALVMHWHTREHWSHLPPHTGSQNEILFKNSLGNWGLFLVQNPPDLSGSPTVFVSLGRRRDTEFLRTNFPDAELVGGNAFGTTYRLPPSQTPSQRLREALADRAPAHGQAVTANNAERMPRPDQ